MNHLSRTAIALSVLGFAAASAFAQAPSTPKQPGMVNTPQEQTAPPAPPSPGATGGSVCICWAPGAAG